MQIIEYNETEQTLCVKYSTNYTWKYWPVTSWLYKRLQKAEDQNKCLSDILRRYNVVGTMKEVAK